jgi:hypothetical protein
MVSSDVSRIAELTDPTAFGVETTGGASLVAGTDWSEGRL